MSTPEPRSIAEIVFGRDDYVSLAAANAQVTESDMLAWLWYHACPDCFTVYVPPLNAAPVDSDEWVNVVTVECCTFDPIVRPSMFAALEAAVRAVAEATSVGSAPEQRSQPSGSSSAVSDTLEPGERK